jgi:hypothetical protein
MTQALIKTLDHLYPLIVPRSYVAESSWDLPHHPFPHDDFILTWVLFDADDAMIYLTREEYEYLNEQHPRWQQTAMENLRVSLEEAENIFTQFKLSADSRRIVFLAFMHQDGIGSSRVLLADELRQSFPAGYALALPDRSCGLLVPQDVTAEELAGVQALVESMYEGATTPMSGALHAPADFVLPATWTQPADPAFSQAIVAEVQALTAG